jgi:hypothetical protein
MIILITSLIVIVLIAFLVTRFSKTSVDEGIVEPQEECCGAHEVCETDLIDKLEGKIVYFDDYELDEYKNFEDKDYTDEQIDAFREILCSLQAKEIEEWVRSLELRGIILPSIIKSEMVFMLLK